PASGAWCLGHRRGLLSRGLLSCSQPSALYRPTGPLGWSMASVARPQTTIDAPSVVDLSAPMCDVLTRARAQRFLLSHVSLLPAADVVGNKLSPNRAGCMAPLEKEIVQGDIRLIWRSICPLLRPQRRGLTTQSVGQLLY
ncbi:hypothetical protein THAOC_12134, partial [Thalassiosira oceanica]